MVVFVSVMVMKTFSISAVSTVTPVRSSILDDALHLMEYCLCIPALVAAAAHGLLDLEQFYGPQDREGMQKKLTKPATTHVIQEGVQTGILYTRVYAHSVLGGIQNRHDGEDHHIRADNGLQSIAETPTSTGVS